MKSKIVSVLLTLLIGGVGVQTIISCSGGDGGSKVVIGGKAWKSKNLEINVPGSKCYGEGSESDTLSDAEIKANCAKYGRLYSWATAMALPSKCDSVLSKSDADCAISVPHQGICPEGWHIPTNDEWDHLYRSADGSDGTNGPYDSPTAGRYLKAREGWENCGPSGSGRSSLCEDTRGFAALPGGNGSSKGGFSDKGRVGYWWSSTAPEASYAYFREMDYSGNGARWHNNDKKALYSVRCAKD